MYKNEYTNKRGKRESVTPKSQCERQDKRKVKKNKYDFKEICEAAVHFVIAIYAVNQLNRGKIGT